MRCVFYSYCRKDLVLLWDRVGMLDMIEFLGVVWAILVHMPVLRSLCLCTPFAGVH